MFSDGELVVADRDDRAEVLLEELRVLLQRGVGVEEDDALLLQVLTDLVVDDLGLVLGGDTGDEALLLRLRDAELVVRVLDVLGQVLPGRGLLLGGAHEVLDVVEVDARQVGAPVRHGLLVEQPQALEAQLQHPLRLVLLRRDVADDVLGQAALGRGAGRVGVGPAEFVRTQALEFGVGSLRGESHAGFLPAVLADADVRWSVVRAARNERRAHTVAVGDGGQPLHMRPEQAGEDLGLRLAQLRVLLGDVGDRAVVLAELLALWGPGALRAVAAYPSALRALARASVRPSGAAASTRLAVGARPGPRSGPGRRRRRPPRLRPPPAVRSIQRRASDGERVVRLVEGVPAAVGEREHLGGPAAGARAVDPLLAGLDHVRRRRGCRGGGGRPPG